ncbi:hypothetical protein FACS1894113_5380 [Alphaproteobacteria bacterium]|nr:hypothetical protein FACS1894113_5380 [Alphaproteobacteria bacterium]
MNILLKIIAVVVVFINCLEAEEWSPKRPWGDQALEMGLVCALVAENILPCCGTSDYKSKKPFLLEKKKNEFLYDAPSGTALILSYLEEFYGLQFADEFWLLNEPLIFEEIKLEELDECAKTVDERYRQKRDYSFYDCSYEIHKEAMRKFHWNNTHYQLPRKNPTWIW